MNKLEQIEKRLAEIDELVKAANSADEIRKLSEESEDLIEQRELIQKLETRKSKATAINEGTATATVIERSGNNTEEEALEKRAAEAKASGRVVIPAAEVRSFIQRELRSITLATGTLAKSTGVDQLQGMFNQVSSVINQVRTKDLTGAGIWDVPYKTATQAAGTRTDGVINGSPTDPTFKVARIQPKIINVLSYVSKNISKLTPVMYEQEVINGALTALKSKINEYILSGDGATFYGMKNAVNTDSEAISQTLEVSSTTIDANFLSTVVFSYGGNENLGANARLFLNKLDLKALGEVRGTNEKKRLFEITPDATNPNTGTIKDGGLVVPYTIDSTLTALSTATKGATAIKTMVYGDPMNYMLGLFGDYAVEVSKDYKFAEGLLTINGEVLAGGNAVVDDGFVVVTLEATE